MDQKKTIRPFSMKDKIGYTLGDLGYADLILNGDLEEYLGTVISAVSYTHLEIDRITEFNPVTGTRQNVVKHVAIFPASHYIVSADKKAAAIEKIRAECDEQRCV